MRRPSNDNVVSAPPIGRRRCPVCGGTMNLSVIEPTYQHGYDIRTFECMKCAYGEIALVNFEDSRGADDGASLHEIDEHLPEDCSKQAEAEQKTG